MSIDLERRIKEAEDKIKMVIIEKVDILKKLSSRYTSCPGCNKKFDVLWDKGNKLWCIKCIDNRCLCGELMRQKTLSMNLPDNKITTRIPYKTYRTDKEGNEKIEICNIDCKSFNREKHEVLLRLFSL